MKIRDLIEELEGLDPNLEVYLQRDAEGNGYETLQYVEEIAVRIDGREIECFSLTYTADDNCMEPEEWEELKKTSKALVLAP